MALPYISNPFRERKDRIWRPHLANYQYTDTGVQ
jgi:hypothetical protein